MIVLTALKSIASLATRGVPAVRSGIFGARLGAGAGFGKSTVEQLGIKVAAPALEAATAIAKGSSALEPTAIAKGAAALVAREVAVARSGVSLTMNAGGGVAATVTEELVSSVARSTVRRALAQIGRATAFGALGGAAIDAVIAGVEMAPGVRDGSIERNVAARHIGKRAARGATAGAVGVVAAGAVSAAVAAAGITIAGAPVVIPIVAMVAAGAFASRIFDRRFGSASPKAKERPILTAAS